MMKSLFLLLLICGSVLVGRAWYCVRDGFSPQRLHGWNASIASSPLSPDMKRILQQRFFYLGRGRQNFAFASEDGLYVLKLPRADYYKLPLWARAVGAKFYPVWEKEKNREKCLLESFRIAIEEMQQETALLATHLRSDTKVGKLKIVDALGREIDLSGDTTYFLLQRKKKLISEIFSDEKMLERLIVFILERAKRGILDKDGLFLQNFGFDEQGIYQLDVGSLYKTTCTQSTVLQSVQPIREWVVKLDPKLRESLDQKINAFLHN